MNDHHAPVWREWRGAMAGQRRHHAWLLAGKRGLGKSEFALAAAHEMVTGGDAAQPDPLHHPDIHYLTHAPADSKEAAKQADGKPFKVKRNIAVEQIRGVQARLTTRPTLGDRRAIIVDPADDLEKGAANALLKSLEEPPVGTFFLLVAHRPGRLLPTIRSRCRVLRFAPLDPETITQQLRAAHPDRDAATLEAAAAASAGSPGRAEEFLALDLAPLHRLMREIARNGDADFTRRGALAAAMGPRPDRERQLAAIDLARAAVAELARDAVPARLPAIADAYAELDQLAGQAPTYNFDPGLLIMQIGTLLTRAASDRQPA